MICLMEVMMKISLKNQIVRMNQLLQNQGKEKKCQTMILKLKAIIPNLCQSEFFSP